MDEIDKIKVSFLDDERLIVVYTELLLRHCVVKISEMQDRLDIIQEVLIDFVKSNKVFDSEKHRRNWLYKVMDNKINDFLRKKYRKNDMEVAQDFVIETAMAVDDNIAASKELLKQISKLPRKQEMVIRMYYLEGYSVEEIKYFLGVKSQQSIWNLLSKARETLRDYLE